MTKLFQAVRQWYAERVAIGELERMNDHLLAGIGVNRSRIVQVIREGVGR